MNKSWLRQEADRQIVLDSIKKATTASALETEEEGFWFGLAHECLFYLQLRKDWTGTDQGESSRCFRELVLPRVFAATQIESEQLAYVAEFAVWVTQTVAQNAILERYMSRNLKSDQP